MPAGSDCADVLAVVISEIDLISFPLCEGNGKGPSIVVALLWQRVCGNGAAGTSAAKIRIKRRAEPEFVRTVEGSLERIGEMLIRDRILFDDRLVADTLAHSSRMGLRH